MKRLRCTQSDGCGRWMVELNETGMPARINRGVELSDLETVNPVPDGVTGPLWRFRSTPGRGPVDCPLVCSCGARYVVSVEITGDRIR